MKAIEFVIVLRFDFPKSVASKEAKTEKERTGVSVARRKNRKAVHIDNRIRQKKLRLQSPRLRLRLRGRSARERPCEQHPQPLAGTTATVTTARIVGGPRRSKPLHESEND